jgi:hypothetical protein
MNILLEAIATLMNAFAGFITDHYFLAFLLLIAVLGEIKIKK